MLGLPKVRQHQFECLHIVALGERFHADKLNSVHLKLQPRQRRRSAGELQPFPLRCHFGIRLDRSKQPRNGCDGKM